MPKMFYYEAKVWVNLEDAWKGFGSLHGVVPLDDAKASNGIQK